MEVITSNEVGTVEAAEIVEGAAVETPVAAEGTVKRSYTDDLTFATTWEETVKAGGAAKEVAAKLGAKPTSVLARASKMRGDGWALSNLPRGGGSKVSPEAAIELMAKLKGITVEQAKAQSDKLIAAAAERAAKRAADKAAEAAPATVSE